MTNKYLVCNTVKVYETHVGGRLHSVVLDSEVPNGQFVYVGGLKEGEREIRVAELPSADKITAEVPMLVMKPEINPSESRKSDAALGIFRNRAGKAVPAIPLTKLDEIELSQDFFVGATPEVGKMYKLTAGSYALTHTSTVPTDAVYFVVTEVRNAFAPITLLADMSAFPVAHKMVTVEVVINK